MILHRTEKQNNNPSRLSIRYTRQSVCMADDYLNHDITIPLRGDATIRDLVAYLQHYREESFSCIPYTGGGNWWKLETDQGILAQVSDDDGVMEADFSLDTRLKELGITAVHGCR